MRCESRSAAIQLAHFLWTRTAGRTIKIQGDIGFGHSQLIQPLSEKNCPVLNSFVSYAVFGQDLLERTVLIVRWSREAFRIEALRIDQLCGPKNSNS